MIIILWAFGIFLLQSRYDFGLRLKRAAPLSRRVPLSTDGGTGGAGSQHRSSARHTRVSTTSQRRAVVDRARGGTTTPPQKPWCCRTAGSASEPSSIPSRQNMYTFYSRGSDPASGFGRVDGQQLLPALRPAFQRENRRY